VSDPRHLVARGYDEIADRYLAWSTDHTVRLQWLTELRAAVPPPAGILDLGCGAGVPVARWLVDAGYAVTGIDGSRVQIERARRNVPEATFRDADMTAVELEPASFDGVVAMYSITHVPRAEHAALFRRIHGWLRPGGILIASLGAGDAPDWTGEWLGTEMFVSHFDAGTNLRLLTEAGFAIERHEVVAEDEEGETVSFLWVLARRPELGNVRT
jgi:2-polyprenyl-3-methyl-5-hydroxy-6-metoxy-1,4-benzoquinol methylase